MELILLEKVANLGELGDTVRVKPGYGRNFLIPNRMAIPATPENLKEIEARRAELEAAQVAALAAAQQRADSMRDVRVGIEARAGTEGKLFGSVGTAEIAEALTAAGHAVAKKEVRLPTGALREVGLYNIEIALHADIACTVQIGVVPEGGSIDELVARIEAQRAQQARDEAEDEAAREAAMAEREAREAEETADSEDAVSAPVGGDVEQD